MDNYFLNPLRTSILSAHMMEVLNFQRFGMAAAPEALSGFNPPRVEAPEEYSVDDGTALIPVRGALASRVIPYWGYCAHMSYEGIVGKIEHAVKNDKVQRIVLQIHSPGGTVTGCAEAASRVRKLSEEKPIWSHCTMADSAAYWLASSTRKISIDPTGEAGSIGVIMTHVDMSKMLDECGVKITHIIAGARKADGSPFAPLSEEVKARFEDDMEILRGQFVDAVATYRDIARADVLATDALTYQGQEAVKAGLADETGFLNDFLKGMPGRTDDFYSLTSNRKDNPMTKKIKNDNPPDDKKLESGAAVENPPEPEGDEEEEQTAEESLPEDEAQDEDQDGKSASSEKDRIKAILSCQEAKGRENLARSLALESDIGVEEARKHLAASPVAVQDDGNPLAKAMQGVGNPKISNVAANATPENPLLASQEKFRPTTLKKQ